MKQLLFTLILLPGYLNAQTITTVVGNGSTGFSGDGGPGAAAQLNRPTALAFDKSGTMYIVDDRNARVRAVSPSGIITTVAGNGTEGSAGDGGPATAAEISPLSIATDTLGNIYISESYRIRKIDAAGIITSIVGDGTFGYNGDGIPATAAKVFEPYLGFADEAGALWFSDSYNHRIRKIDNAGIISTVAGTGVSGSAGDGGPATAANLPNPHFLYRNTKGELIVPDIFARRTRKIDASGIIDAFAGYGAGGSLSGDGGPAVKAAVANNTSVACDDSGNTYLCMGSANVIRKVNAAGIISKVAGTGVAGFGGDNGPALLAQMNNLSHMAMYKGDIYVTDTYNDRIRRISFNNPLSSPDLSTVSANILLYPNPTTNALTISTATIISKVEVLNIAGQVVVSYEPPAGTLVTISTHDMSHGLYILRVNDVYAGRFLKE